jgi:hypothetical protein
MRAHFIEGRLDAMQNEDQAGEPKWLKKAEMRLKRSRRKTSAQERQALSRGFFSAG